MDRWEWLEVDQTVRTPEQLTRVDLKNIIDAYTPLERSELLELLKERALGRNEHVPNREECLKLERTMTRDQRISLELRTMIDGYTSQERSELLALLRKRS